MFDLGHDHRETCTVEAKSDTGGNITGTTNKYQHDRFLPERSLFFVKNNILSSSPSRLPCRRSQKML